MAVNASLLPDGSVSVTDSGTTFPPLSPDAVQAVAAVAEASANAHKTQAMTELLAQLALLITSAGQSAGDAAYAQVTVSQGAATAVLDPMSFELVQKAMPGNVDAQGNWVSGPLTVSQQQQPPTPTPTPMGGNTCCSA